MRLDQLKRHMGVHRKKGVGTESASVMASEDGEMSTATAQEE